MPRSSRRRAPTRVRAAVDKALADYNEHMGKGYEVDEENQTLKMIKGLSTKDIDADKSARAS